MIPEGGGGAKVARTTGVRIATAILSITTDVTSFEFLLLLGGLIGPTDRRAGSPTATSTTSGMVIAYGIPTLLKFGIIFIRILELRLSPNSHHFRLGSMRIAVGIGNPRLGATTNPLDVLSNIMAAGCQHIW